MLHIFNFVLITFRLRKPKFSPVGDFVWGESIWTELEELWIEDVEYEVYLLNKHATEGRVKYLEAKKWANKPRELSAWVFINLVLTN